MENKQLLLSFIDKVFILHKVTTNVQVVCTIFTSATEVQFVCLLAAYNPQFMMRHPGVVILQIPNGSGFK